MDRVPYRRITPPRDSKISSNEGTYRQGLDVNKLVSNPDNEKITPGETLLVQLIISGVLMLAVLLVCLINIGPLVSLRSGLRQVLTGATTIEEFATEVRHFSQEWLNVEPTPITEEPETPIFYFPELPLVNPQGISPVQNPPTAYEETLNPQLPGPLVSPGLWD